MSNAWLTESAPDFHAAFLDAGMADTATLTRANSTTTTANVRVYVDRDFAVDEAGGVEFLTGSVLVHLLRADVASAPRRGDKITVGTDVFTVDRPGQHQEDVWVVLCQA